MIFDSHLQKSNNDGCDSVKEKKHASNINVISEKCIA